MKINREVWFAIEHHGLFKKIGGLVLSSYYVSNQIDYDNFAHANNWLIHNSIKYYYHILNTRNSILIGDNTTFFTLIPQYEVSNIFKREV